MPEPGIDTLPESQPWPLTAHDEKHVSDVHVYIPRLSKKGVLFKLTAKMIDQRAAEFNALVAALLDDGLPPHVQELCQEKDIHGFFAYWRRDHDFAQRDEVKKVVSNNLASSSTPSSTISKIRSSMSTTSPISSASTPSLTSASSGVSEASTPWTPSSPQDLSAEHASSSSSSQPSQSPRSPVEMQNRNLMAQVSAWRTSEESSRKSRRMKELADLVVRVDTVEEVFEDRRNTLKPEVQYDVEKLGFRSVSPSIPPEPSMPNDSQDDLTRPESPLSIESGPSESRSIYSNHTSSTSTSFRSRPLPTLPISVQGDGRFPQVNGLQPVPVGVVPGARIMDSPSLFSHSPEPPRSTPEPVQLGLPIPPSARRRQGSQCDSPHASPIHRLESSEGFSSCHLDEDGAFTSPPSYLPPPFDRQESMASVSSSVVSDGDTNITTSHQIQRVVNGRLSSAVPRVVWLKPQLSPTAFVESSDEPDAPQALRTFANSTDLDDSDSEVDSDSDLDLDLVSEQAISIIEPERLSTFLEMDVHNRWWRSSTSTDSTAKPNALAESFTDYPPDEVFDSMGDAGQCDSDGASTVGEYSMAAALEASSSVSSGPPSPDIGPMSHPYSAPTIVSISSIRGSADRFERSTSEVTGSRSVYDHHGYQPRHVMSAALSHSSSDPGRAPRNTSSPPTITSFDRPPYSSPRSADYIRQTSSQHAQDWAMHVPTASSMKSNEPHRSSQLLRALMPTPRTNPPLRAGPRPFPGYRAIPS
jgi:hypothetical protein